MKLRALIFCLLQLYLFSSIAYSKEPIEEKCGYVMHLLQYALQGIDSNNVAFSLKRNGETYYTCIMSLSDESRTKVPWRLLERQGQTTDHCVIGSGNTVEMLESLNNSDIKERYGLPGSGYPQCSNDKSLLPGSFLVRLWANRELGESSVFFLNSEIGQKDYILLISNDGHWVIIDIDKTNNQACYLSRGDSTAIHEDIASPPMKK